MNGNNSYETFWEFHFTLEDHWIMALVQNLWVHTSHLFLVDPAQGLSSVQDIFGPMTFSFKCYAFSFSSMSSLIWKWRPFYGHTFQQHSDKCINFLSVHRSRGFSWGKKNYCHYFQVSHSVCSRGSKTLVRKLNSDKQLCLSSGALIEIEPHALDEEQSESSQNECESVKDKEQPTLTFKKLLTRLSRVVKVGNDS